MVMLFRSDTLPNFAICWLLFPFLWRKQYIFSTINPNCSARRELKKSTGITSPPYLTLSLTNAIVAPGAHTLYISAYTKASSVKYPCTILIIPSLFKSPCSSLCFSAFVTSLSTALSSIILLIYLNLYFVNKVRACWFQKLINQFLYCFCSIIFV